MTNDYRPRRAESSRGGWPRLGAVGVLAALLVLGILGFALLRPVPATAPTPVAGSAAASATSASVVASGTAVASAAVSETQTPTPEVSREVVTVSSVPNFRDVAGVGIELADGATMATGVVYRAAKLSTLSKADAAKLADAGVSDIFDLRTPDVARRSPDVKIEGATNRLVNLYALDRAPSPPRTNAAAAKDFMRGLYVGFVDDADQRKRIASVLKEVAQVEQPVIVHCSEGKDRTGWVSAMLQFVAGADRETVLEQYLLSNQEREALIAKSYAAAKRTSGVAAADIDRALKTVEASYLNAGLAQVEKRYGSVDGYLSKGLGLKQETLDALRAKLRVEAR